MASLIARSKLARAVAAHVLSAGAQAPIAIDVCSPEAYKRALLRLEQAGVLRRWSWEAEDWIFEPRCPSAGYLWLAGPLWDAFTREAAACGLCAVVRGDDV